MQTDYRYEQLKLIINQLLGDLDDSVLQSLFPHLEWVSLLGGEILYRQNEPGDGMCIVVSGRLRAIHADESGRQHVLGDAVRGEPIGEVALFTNEPRMATVYAVRDSVLVRMSKHQYEELIRLLPQFGIHISRLAINRLRKRQELHKKPYKTLNVTLFPISKGIETSDFTRRLFEAIQPYARVLHLNRETVRQYEMSEHSVDLAEWLNEQESYYDLVLYEADSAESEWTSLCFRQADDVLLLANGTLSAELGPLELSYLRSDTKRTTATQTLLIVHPDDTVRPQRTADWLQQRPGLSHFHIRESNRNDFSRLGRFLTGNAVGLVLAGGGARGLVHVGVFRALREANIPIDFVGGTSIGSIGASLIALYDLEVSQIIEKATRAAQGKPTSAQDYTLPVVSLMNGRNMDKIMDDLYDGIAIEDLFIPFFCISSNFTRSEIYVHCQGSLRQAVRASCSIPGIFPPVIIENNFHIDGAIFDNLPVETMCQMRVGRIIAVSLEQEVGHQLRFDRMPSPWELFRDYYRNTKKYEVPSLISIVTKATTLNSTYKNRHFRPDIDLFLNPDVTRYSYTNWGIYQDLFDMGYRYTKQVLATLADESRFWETPQKA